MIYALLISLHLCRATITEINNGLITATTESGNTYEYYGSVNGNDSIILVMDDAGRIVNAF